MDSLLEKITLYDILGYMVPGIFFITLVLLPLDPQTIMPEIELIEKIGTAFTLAAIAASYVCGLVLSEAARWLVDLYAHLLPDSCLLSGAVEKEQIISALKSSKLVKEENLSPDMEIGAEYYQLMNGAIQADGEYKRIHNYASAVILYKNLACAAFLSILVRHMFWQNPGGLYDMAGLGLTAIFVVRWARFQKKVRKYTEIFFVEKYLAK